jgi:hypothetical protein
MVPQLTPRKIVCFNSTSYIGVIPGTKKLIVYINGSNIITGTTTIEVGQWYFIVLTTNGTNYNLYLDNVSEGSNNSIGISLSDVMFSTSASFVQWRWHGRLDCIGIFDKVLNADERAFLWNDGEGTERLKAGLARPLVGGSLVGSILAGKGLV